MAFAWDDLQEKWLERRLAPAARRFESKVTVAGGNLELDAVAEKPRGDAFLDFLTRWSVFENKAPKTAFGLADLYLLGARTLLFAERRELGLSELADLTQVVLCSHATKEVRREVGRQELHPGVLEGRFVARLVLVEANRVPVSEESLGFLLYWASGKRLREAIEATVDGERREYYSMLWFMRKDEFREVLAMKGKTLDETTLSVREAVEELGIERVVDAVGLERVVAAVGLERVVDAVGLEQIGDSVGVERIRALLRRMEARVARRPAARRKPARRR
ncbi:MAG: hypothetical protein HYZ53_26195 [Planctomycetes bacterium]|nr:hypothetical protein [Planctomycetota bacterium]